MKILLTFISKIGFQIANQGSFRNLINWQDISDSQTGFFSTIDILSTVHAFSCDEVFALLFEPVGVSEGDFCEGRSSAAVVDYFFHHSFDVAVALGEVQVSELRFVKSVVVVRFEDTFWISSSLVADYSTHFFNLLIY